MLPTIPSRYHALVDSNRSGAISTEVPGLLSPFRSTMSHTDGVSHQDLDALRRIDSCTLANAIETLNLRPRNEGFVQRSLSCIFPKLPPVLGHAVTGRMRAAVPPISGHCYYDHVEWWRFVESVPPPRIIVLLDADDPPGAGALFGELHARICTALKCVAYVTNGAVRDVPGIERVGFQVFAGNISVSHAYAHVVDYGQPIRLGGLQIHSGDLLHGDLHGILSVPRTAVKALPDIVRQLLRDEERFKEMCLDGDFSIDRLAAAIQKHAEAQKCK
jgi:4-hydroxy-4-methyl-2-oxoglutarate aldolase